MDEFFGDQTEPHYLVVDVTEPDAALKVKRWRVRCRERLIPSVVIALRGEVYLVEVRLPGAAESLHRSTHEFYHFPLFEFRGGGSSGGGIHFEMTGPESAEIAADCIFFILRGICSEERRLLRNRESSPVARRPRESSTICVSAGSFSFSTRLPGLPQMRFRLPSKEYEILDATIRHFSEGERLRLWNTSFYFNAEELATRFPELDESLLQDALSKEARFQWEERFDVEVDLIDPELIERGDYIPTGGLSRPAIGQSEAVVRVETPTFQGFAWLRKEDVWQVTHLSYDEDWTMATFEPFPKFSSRWAPEKLRYDRWKDFGIPFPPPETNFYEEIEPEESNDIFESLSSGSAPKRLLSVPFIPLIGGPLLTMEEFLLLARDRGRVYYDCEASELADAVRAEGEVVVELGSESSPCLAKLLAFSSEQFGCEFLRGEFALCLEPTNEEACNLQLMEAILKRAGFPLLGFGLVESLTGQVYFQDLGKRFASRFAGTLEGKQGKILVPRSSFWSFEHSPIRTIGEICELLELDLSETKKVWHAAGVELAWKGDNGFF